MPRRLGISSQRSAINCATVRKPSNPSLTRNSIDPGSRVTPVFALNPNAPSTGPGGWGERPDLTPRRPPDSATIAGMDTSLPRRFQRYVAIGDSSTEGIDDPDKRGAYQGWSR